MLNAISRARPRIANYAFTTLYPMLGIVEFDDYTRITVADLPGIIDGAHENRGLGLSFLRHIERTKVLCYVLDFSGKGTDQAVEQFEALQYELDCYKAGMTNRPSVIAANKFDLPHAQPNLEYFKVPSFFLRSTRIVHHVFARSRNISKFEIWMCLSLLSLLHEERAWSLCCLPSADNPLPSLLVHKVTIEKTIKKTISNDEDSISNMPG